jgi:hypothetical protein
MEIYRETDLRWVMASFSGFDMYGPSRRVFRYAIPRAALVLHNFGNRYNDEWRIGVCDERDNVLSWSVAHYPSIGSVLAVLDQVPVIHGITCAKCKKRLVIDECREDFNLTTITNGLQCSVCGTVGFYDRVTVFHNPEGRAFIAPAPL